MRFDLSKIDFNKSDIKKHIILPKRMSADLAEEVGLHLGDGSMNFYKNRGFYQLRGHITDDKEHYNSRIKFLYKKLYNLDIHIRDMKSTGVIGFQIWSDAIINFKNKIIGLPLGKKDKIMMPDVIHTKVLFFSFLRGLFDTDGSLYIENKRGKKYPRIDLKTTSKKLSSQIFELLNKYGINNSLYEYKRKEKNWNNLYSVIVRGFKNVRRWQKYVGSNNPKHIKKFGLVDQVV